MLAVLVDVRVKEGWFEKFVEATNANARESRKEPGIFAFDLYRDPADPAHFMLVEVYRDSEAPARHKETAHYQAWRDAVEPMMQIPRKSAKWETLDVRGIES
ncbi:MAG: antibiotic biosynthesis monooxygenase [Polyangiaceae bacterium]